MGIINIAEEYQNGIDDYEAGSVPAGWDDPDRVVRSPYLSGWYQASLVDNGLPLDNEEDELWGDDDD